MRRGEWLGRRVAQRIAGTTGGLGARDYSPRAPLAGSSTKGSVPSTDAVAVVGGVAITKPLYEHWTAIERAHGAAGNAGRAALGFLITYEWVVGEAGARHIAVSEAQLKREPGSA